MHFNRYNNCLHDTPWHVKLDLLLCALHIVYLMYMYFTGSENNKVTSLGLYFSICISGSKPLKKIYTRK